MILTSWLKSLNSRFARRSVMHARRTSARAPQVFVERLEDRSLLSTLYVDEAADYTVTTNNVGGAGADNGDVVTWNGSTPVAGLVFGTSAFSSIQTAINASTANDTIVVAAGTFAENLWINKKLSLQGANAGINPNTGMPVAATVITTNTNDFDFTGPSVNDTLVRVTANGVTLDGFTLDGDNSAISNGYRFGMGGQNGADINIQLAIANFAPGSNSSTAISGLTVQNNVVQNFNYAGVVLYNTSNSASQNNLVTANQFDNIQPEDNPNFGLGFAVLAGSNAYTSVTNNVMTQVRVGVETTDFFRAAGVTQTVPLEISGNTIESSSQGIWINLHQVDASAYTVSNNTITSISNPLAPIDNFNEFGAIRVQSIYDERVVTVSNNIISGNLASTTGYQLTTIESPNVTVSGGTVTNTDVGIWMSGDFDLTQVSLTGISISSSTTGLYMSGAGAVLVGDTIGTLSFSTVDEYIVLANFATNSGNYIDGTWATYDGFLGNNVTVAQGLDIEDKIFHATDDNTLGFVRVKTANVYVTQTSGSIQRGIDVAESGDTVNVGAGTFAENLLISDSLSLIGQGTASTFVTGMSGARISLSGASTITLQELALTGTGSSITSTGVTSLTLNNVASPLTGSFTGTTGTVSLSTTDDDDTVAASGISFSTDLLGAISYSTTGVTNLIIDTLDGDDDIFVVGPATGGTVISVDGGAESMADTLYYDSTGATVTDNGFTISGAGRTTVTYTDIEVTDLAYVGGTANDDTLILRLNSGVLQYNLNGGGFINVTDPTSFTFNGFAGNDQLIIDYSGGFFAIPVFFHGGFAVGDNDQLTVTGGSFATVTSNYNTFGANEQSGNIVYAAGMQSATITYDGVEPIDVSGSTIASLILNLPGAADQPILEDVGTASDGSSRIRSQNATPTFAATTFGAPTSLTVNMGGDAGALTVASMDTTFNSGLVINGQAGADTVSFTGTNSSLASLMVTATGGISSTASAVLGVTGLASFNAGSSAISLIAASSLNFGSLTVVGGSVTVFEDSATVLAGSNSASSLSLTSAAGITDTSTSLSVTNNATLSGTSIAIGGAGATTNFGSLTFTSAGAVTVQEDSSTVVTGVNSALSLSLTSTAGITDTSTSLAVTNNASFSGTSIDIGGGGITTTLGSLTFNSAGAVNIQVDAATAITGVNTAMSLSLSSTGAITDTSTSLTVTNNASFNGTSISVGGAGPTTNFGNLTFTSAGAVSIQEDSATVLAGTNTAASLTLTSAAAITDTGTVVVSGLTILNAGAGASNIVLDSAVNDFGSLQIAAANAVTLVDVNSINFANTSTTAAALTVTAGTSITQSMGSSLLIGGKATLSATMSVVLNSITNDFNTIQVNAASASIIDANGIVFSGATTLSGALTVATLGGTITDAAIGSLSVGGLATFNSGASNTVLDTATNDFNTVTVTANVATFVDANAISFAGTSLIAADFNVTATTDIGSTGSVNVGGKATLSAGGNITFNNSANDFNTVEVDGVNVSLVDTNAIVFANGVTSTVTGTLDVLAGGAISDAGTGDLKVTGVTTLTATVPSDIILDSATNDFSTVNADGRAVTLVDLNSLAVDTITGSISVALTAGGAITDANGGTLNITTPTLTATSATGVDLDTSVTTVTASASGIGAITLREADAVTLASITTNDGLISVSAGGALTVTTVSAGGTGRNVTLSTTAGGISLGVVSADGDSINLTAVGAITDNNAAANNLTAASAILSSTTGIGSSGDPIETVLSQVQATTGTGGIFLSNTSAALATSGVISATTSGDISVVTSADLTIGHAVTATSGTVSLTSGSPGNASVFAVNAAVTGSGAVTLSGGTNNDNITVSNTVTGSTVTVNGLGGSDLITLAMGGSLSATGLAKIDAGAGNDTIIVTGTMGGATNQVLGGSENDSITINRTGATALAVDGNDGNDTTTINQSGVTTAQINVADSGASMMEVDSVTIVATAAAETIDVNRTTIGTVSNTTLMQVVTFSTTLESVTVQGGNGNDTFLVNPSTTAVINVDGGLPRPLDMGFVIPGDTLDYNPVGNAFNVQLNQIITGDGIAFKNVSFVGIENLPFTPLGATTWRFDLDDPNFGAAATAAGYTAVLPSRVYGVSGNTYGWNVAVGSSTSGGPTALLQDFHFGTAARTFSADVANGYYLISITTGNPTGVSDYTVVAEAGPLQTGLTGVRTTATGSNVQKTFVAGVFDGKLDLTFSDGGFGDGLWMVNSIEIRPAVLLSASIQPVLFGLPSTAETAPADGSSIDTIQSIAVPGGANAIYTVEASLGTIITADANPNYAGIQVQANAMGVFSFQVRRPSGSGLAVFTAVDVTGAKTGVASVNYVGNDVRRFDFNAGGPTQSPVATPTSPNDYIGVEPGAVSVYTPVLGYGWTSATAGVNSGAAGVLADLRRDGHGGNAANTFNVDLSNGTYLVTVTMGDSFSPKDGMRIVAEGNIVADNISSNSTTWATRTFQVSVNDGQLNLTFSDQTPNSGWIVNGVEIRKVTLGSPSGGITLSGPGSIAASSTTPATITGTTTGLADGTLVTVRTSIGTIVSTDAANYYDGVQVVVMSNSFTVQVLPNGTAGTPRLTAVTVDGVGYTFDGTTFGYQSATILDFSAAGFTKGFDFNNVGTANFTGYTAVERKNLYSDAAGFGWNAIVRSSSTTVPGSIPGSQTSLYQDFHFGTDNTFSVKVPNAAYYVTLYIGDSAGAFQMQVSLEGGAPVTVGTTAGMLFAAVNLGPVTVSDGILNIQLVGLGANAWHLNGLKVSTSVISSPLQLGAVGGTSAFTVSDADLGDLKDAAIARWAASGLTSDQIAVLRNARISITELNGQGELGNASADGIQIDNDALGFGWFIDSTPFDDAEFTVAVGDELYATSGAAATRVDLLSVLMHEMGHLIGHIDLDPVTAPHQLMTGEFNIGARRSVDGSEAVSSAPVAASLRLEASVAMPSLGELAGEVTQPKASVTNGPANAAGIAVPLATRSFTDEADQVASVPAVGMAGRRDGKGSEGAGRLNTLDLAFARLGADDEGDTAWFSL